MHPLTLTALFVSGLLSGPLAAEDRQGQLPATDPGDAERGKQVFLDRQRGHCLLCHQLSAAGQDFQGNIAPSLDGVSRRLDAAQLRYRIVDPTRLSPDTVMPAYHRTRGLVDVAPRFRDRPVLTAQEIEDTVAYLIEAGQ